MSWQQKFLILYSKFDFLHPKMGQFEHFLKNPGSGPNTACTVVHIIFRNCGPILGIALV